MQPRMAELHPHSTESVVGSAFQVVNPRIGFDHSGSLLNRALMLKLRRFQSGEDGKRRAREDRFPLSDLRGGHDQPHIP